MVGSAMLGPAVRNDAFAKRHRTRGAVVLTMAMRGPCSWTGLSTDDLAKEDATMRTGVRSGV